VNMSPTDEQVPELKRLLALKRHERPPPGHFDRLARNIRRALEAEEPAGAASWWERLLSRFDMEPAWAAALACAVVAAYFYGWAWSHQTEPQKVAVPLPASPDWVAATHPVWAAYPASPAPRANDHEGRVGSPLRSSVHPIIGMEPVRGWLTPNRTPEVLPVSFSVGGQ